MFIILALAEAFCECHFSSKIQIENLKNHKKFPPLYFELDQGQEHGITCAFVRKLRIRTSGLKDFIVVRSRSFDFWSSPDRKSPFARTQQLSFNGIGKYVSFSAYKLINPTRLSF